MILFKGGRRGMGGNRTGRSKDFGRLVAYLTRTSPDANRLVWASCRNLDGVDEPRRAAQVMAAYAGEHPRTEQPVYHFGLSLHAAEHLGREQWERAVGQVLERLGLARHQALIVAHGDTGNEHVHVVVNRIGDDGRTWSPDLDCVQARPVVRRIERDYGLIRNERAAGQPLPDVTSDAYMAAARTGRQPLADRVREQAAADFSEAAGWPDLEARLAARGFRLAQASRHPGLVVTDGVHFTALSRVDGTLSGPKLASRFGETFDHHRQAHPGPHEIPAGPPGRTAAVDPRRSPEGGTRVPEASSTPGTAAAPAAHESARQPGASREHRAADLLRRVTETTATFAEADLRRATFYQPDSAALVRAALRSDQVLDLGKDAGGVHRYTTREYLDAEARLLAAATRLSSRHHHRLAAGGTGRTLAATTDAAAPVLAPAAGAPAPAVSGPPAEQRAAVLHATTANDLVLIAGAPDAARTAAARDVAAACREHGYEVRGTAVTARAAAALASGAGIRASPLAGLEAAWSRGADPLHSRCVLVVDEAGMLDVRHLGRVLDHAGDCHAKVVLLGDPDRRQTIGAGDAFRGLLEHYPSVSLDALDRQREPARRTAGKRPAGRSAAGRKDLAGDYAAAELRRAVAHLQGLAADTNRVILEERPLRDALAALSSLLDARLHVVDSRRALARAAGLVYGDPVAALRGLLRDPQAPARLRQGEARVYGKLHGGIGLAAPRRERAQALQAALTLSGWLDSHQRTITDLRAAKQTARAKASLLTLPGLQAPNQPRTPADSRGLPAAAAPRAPTSRLPRPAQISGELARVTAVLGACRQATHRAQDALETAIRRMRPATVDSALLLLPPKLALPVEVAVRAVAHVLERGLDLGLGR